MGRLGRLSLIEIDEPSPIHLLPSDHEPITLEVEGDRSAVQVVCMKCFPRLPIKHGRAIPRVGTIMQVLLERMVIAHDEKQTKIGGATYIVSKRNPLFVGQCQRCRQVYIAIVK